MKKLVLPAVLAITAVAFVGHVLRGSPVLADGPQPTLVRHGRLPLHFEANQGQTAEPVEFLSRGRGYELFLTPTESVLVLRTPGRVGKGHGASHLDGVVRMRLLGANPRPIIEGRDVLPGRSHYFIGSDPRRWRTNVTQYARVEYEDVYPGVSLAFHGDQGQLEYDFTVNSGADPELIRLGIEGADEIRVDPEGNLHLSLPGGEVVQPAPVVYQEIGGSRRAVAGRFVLRSSREVGFEVGPYDTGRPLVLDPVLVYSTYLGGSDTDNGLGVAVDVSGNAYLTGETASTDFPTANALQSANGGGLDAFVVKLNAAGSALEYSTYLGGSGRDTGARIAVDASGRAYVTGETDSTDFPTANALQAAFAGVADAFVAKLDATGSALVYSTYLGGANFDSAGGIAVDALGNADVTGRTASTDFPTANALQAESAGALDAFVAKLNAAGSAFIYSTYVGGSGDDTAYGVADDGSGNAYVTGTTSSRDFPTANALQPENAGGDGDAFVAKLDAAGSALVYSTYLGGSGFEVGSDITVDASRSAHVTGHTSSVDFPTFRAFQAKSGGGNDAFVTKLNPTGSALAYSTYLGGSRDDIGWGIAVDTARNAYVTGSTVSPDFPTRSPLQAEKGAASDAFVTKLNTALGGTSLGSLMYSTYLGGNDEDVAYDIAVDGSRNAYIGGYTESIDFPTHDPLQPANAGEYDVFVSKIGTR
jgi:beta-propeller repeat-containing protein